MKIAIFLAARTPNSSSYFPYIDELVTLLKQYKTTIIYGGTSAGLMGYLGNKAVDNGLKIIGIMPKNLETFEKPLETLNKIIFVKDLYARKKKMFSMSSICLALPGGFGTLDEIFEAITLNQIKYHDKKIIFLNVLGYYNHLKKFIDHMLFEGFIIKESYSNIYFIDDIAELTLHLKNDEKIVG